MIAVGDAAGQLVAVLDVLKLATPIGTASGRNNPTRTGGPSHEPTAAPALCRQQSDGGFGEADRRGESSWEDRWAAFCTCVQNCAALAARDHLSRDEVIAELSGELARRIVERFDTSPIADIYQPMLYFGSSDGVHRGMSEGWQRMHPGEMQALQAEHPEIPNLIREVPPDERGYMLNLRQSAYLALAAAEARATWGRLALLTMRARALHR